MAATATKLQLSALAIMLLALLLGPAAGEVPCFVGWLPPVLGKFSVCGTSPFAGSNKGGQPTGKGLSQGYYSQSCPNAEELVRKAVYEGTKNNRGLNAGLIRLHFHDCFVRGCDASVLLDITEDRNPDTEKTGPPNQDSLRGFQVIDAAKKAVENACPGKVSCADILAMAARDASDILSDGKIKYKVLLGRLDGRKSKAGETNQLPGPGSNLQELTDSFAAQGLSQADMVTLSGAHTVGITHCMFATRQKEMDPVCASKLKATCAAAGSSRTTVPQDFKTPDGMDNQYYKNIDKCVVFPSDAALNSSATIRQVNAYAVDDGTWERYFGEAMRKMGNIGVTTTPGYGFEIRKVCSQVNSY